MKIQYFSDTHGLEKFDINPDADLIIHVGDADDGPKLLLKFVDQCNEAKKDHLIVPGNHDFWGFNIEDLYKWFDDHNINYLAPEKPYVKDGITFVGGTLFSNFRSNTLDPWDVDKSKIHCGVFKDFRKIYIDNTLVNPSNYITEFNKCWNYIQRYRGIDNVIIITHFPPKPTCTSPIFDPFSTVSGYFSNNLDITGFKTWIYGHTHFNSDFIQDGCRLLSNSLGYFGEDTGKPYDPNLMLEI